MVLHFGHEEWECDKAVKGDDYIHLFKDGDCIIHFEMIDDFTGFSIEGGEYTLPDTTPEEKLRADVDFLLMMEGEI